jgi:hypothetical protein
MMMVEDVNDGWSSKDHLHFPEFHIKTPAGGVFVT